MAVKNGSIAEGLIFHSDRSIQYASEKFANVFDSYKFITQSMRRKVCCWGNSVVESFFVTLKTELFYGNKLVLKDRIRNSYIRIWEDRKEAILR
jgi:putative transposase